MKLIQGAAMPLELLNLWNHETHWRLTR